MSWTRTWQSRKIKLNRRFFGSGSLTRIRFFKLAALGLFLAIIASVIGGVVLFAWSARNLPSPDKIVRREGFATKIFDRNGQLLYDVYSQQRRIPVNINDIPLNLKNATIAIEDKNFYHHQGYDPLGWLRSIYNIIVKHQLTGGSTLTQQLVKNVLLSPERTMTRKIKEFILAVQIEKKYSKDQILQMYLNEAPYGGTAWGVEAAAETYFGKKTSELNLVESAILAALPQRPSYYSPFGAYPKAYILRTEDVLRRMREDGYITPAQERDAVSKLPNFKFRDQEGQFEAPHFVMYVKGLLEEQYGEKMIEQGGLRITTTLDLDIQKKAQEVVTEEIKKVEDVHITNGAAMVLDPQTGEILAMVGSKDYNDPNYDGKVNVTLSLRQPGSSIKPITYVTAFLKGYTPATMLVDTKTEFPGGLTGKPYVPVNYDGKNHGPVDLRHSLGSSLNINSVKLLALIGVKDMLNTAYKMGLTTLEPTQANVNKFGLSVTLGGGDVRLIDMVGAYSAFANSGYKVEPTAILKVEDGNGKVLFEKKPQKGERVLSAAAAYLINNILSDNKARLLTFGENSLLNISGQTVAVKTGTTDDKRDNWTIGWTPTFLVGVWVGNNDNSAMKQVASGVSGASPIWRRVVLYLLTRYPATEFGMPDGIDKVSVDNVSGWPSHDGYAAHEEVMLSGTAPTGDDPIHKKIKICKGQKDKLATQTMIARGDYEEREVIDLKEDDPLSSDGKNRWQEGINAWINSQSDEKYKIPGEYCNQNQEVVVQFKKPDDKQQINTNDVEIEIEAVANSNINKVELYADGDKKETFSDKPYRTTLVLGNGVHTLKAQAWDDKNNNSQVEIKIGVNQAVDSGPSPNSSPPPSPSPTPTPSSSLSPSPTPTPPG
jgi:1A family penicillin-binding protein